MFLPLVIEVGTLGHLGFGEGGFGEIVSAEHIRARRVRSPLFVLYDCQ